MEFNSTEVEIKQDAIREAKCSLILSKTRSMIRDSENESVSEETLIDEIAYEDEVMESLIEELNESNRIEKVENGIRIHEKDVE